MPDEPTTYFKYAKFDTAWNILDNRTLRWSRPDCFNDPFDMQMELQADFDVREVTELALDNIWNRCNGRGPASESRVARTYEAHAKELVAVGRERFDEGMRPGVIAFLEGFPKVSQAFRTETLSDIGNIKLLCLSEVGDSILMWTHYAEDHYGVMLEFQNVEGLDSPYRIARKINYTDKVPQLADSQEIANIISGDGKLSRDVMDRLIYSKSAAWAYEREVRIATGPGRSPDMPTEDVPFHAPELKAVYFGCRTQSDKAHAIATLTQQRFPHAELWSTVRGRQSWTLTFEPYRPNGN